MVQEGTNAILNRDTSCQPATPVSESHADECDCVIDYGSCTPA
jgi:hypothetical protein